MSKLRTVSILVSGTITGDLYYARSYPDDDFDNNGKVERYETPVYWIYIDGTDLSGSPVRKTWKCLRFMPYWNDPKKPSGKYKDKGWIDSGKVKVAKKAVVYYDPNYTVHNRFSPYNGGIQISGNFLVHAGPTALTDHGWGAAGCVEVIGHFDAFKNDLRDLSGSRKTDGSAAISELVAAKKLFIEMEYAAAPKLQTKLNGEF